ncbi:MAG: phenylalanine--tRNA ligase subunit alpha [Candidatus Ranarchaeia archaeon]
MKNLVLRPIEAELLEKLKAEGGSCSIDVLAKKVSGGHVSVIRVAEWLREKKLVELTDRTDRFLTLTQIGKQTALEGLPERQILDYLLKTPKRTSSIKELKAKLSKELGSNGFNAGLGWIQRKGWASLGKGILSAKVQVAPPKNPDEELLELLLHKGTMPLTGLQENLLAGLDLLRERKGLIEIQTRTERSIKLTTLGKKSLAAGLKIKEALTKITPELLRSGRWRDAEIQAFDVTAPVASVYPGKIHPFYQIVRMIRRIFLDMGFSEIRGPIVELAFWNFDALFQPQDHPAREIQDTFYLETPKKGVLPGKELWEKIKKTHENGWTTGSTGWGGKWSQNIARQLVLRTHTTATTIHYLQENPEPPQKAFCIDRVYRNEKIDYSHLAEFHQMEGVVMDKGVTLRDLKGILTAFYNKMGFKKIQFWPSFFPYTEPSLQSSVYVPSVKAWVELCGMGIFRPEVTKPLGINYPVLAWGGGVERLIMLKLGLTDIRQIFRNDLAWLRREPTCLP